MYVLIIDSTSAGHDHETHVDVTTLDLNTAIDPANEVIRNVWYPRREYVENRRDTLVAWLVSAKPGDTLRLCQDTVLILAGAEAPTLTSLPAADAAPTEKLLCASPNNENSPP